MNAEQKSRQAEIFEMFEERGDMLTRLADEFRENAQDCRRGGVRGEQDDLHMLREALVWEDAAKRLDETLNGMKSAGHSGLQELLDEYAALRVADRFPELVTQIHQAMQTRAEKKISGSLFEHASAIATHIVKSRFPVEKA